MPIFKKSVLLILVHTLVDISTYNKTGVLVRHFVVQAAYVAGELEEWLTVTSEVDVFRVVQLGVSAIIESSDRKVTVLIIIDLDEDITTFVVTSYSYDVLLTIGKIDVW